MNHLTAPELAKILHEQTAKLLLLDVREPWEFETCHISASQNIPMRTIPAQLDNLDVNSHIVCICHHGGRSMQVANFLEQHGFKHVTNLTGGVHAWAQLVDNSMPTY